MALSLEASWLNGNLTFVVDEILQLPTPHAAVLTSIITGHFHARGLRGDSATLQRLIGKRFDR